MGEMIATKALGVIQPRAQLTWAGRDVSQTLSLL